MLLLDALDKEDWDGPLRFVGTRTIHVGAQVLRYPSPGALVEDVTCCDRDTDALARHAAAYPALQRGLRDHAPWLLLTCADAVADPRTADRLREWYRASTRDFSGCLSTYITVVGALTAAFVVWLWCAIAFNT